MSRATNKSIQLQNLLDRILDSTHRFCFCDDLGQIISAKPSLPLDLMAMAQAGKLVKDYLKPSDGDIILTNDPEISGCGLSEFVAILYFQASPKSKELFFICEKFLAGDLIWEGMDKDSSNQSLPPVPVFTNDELQAPMLDAMEAGFGSHFKDRVLSSINRLQTIRLQLFDLSLWNPQLFEKSSIEALFRSTLMTTHESMEEFRFEEQKLSKTFMGSRLQMKLQKEEQVHIDFNRCELNSPFTFDDTDYLSCASLALVYALGGDIPLNHGLLSYLSIKPPRTKSEKRTASGNSLTQLLMAPLVCELILTMLNQIHREGITASNACLPLLAGLEFANGQSFSRPFLGGGGASLHLHGKRGWNPWLKDFATLSIEYLESHYPLRVGGVVSRPQSGGRGEKNGGEGLSWTFHLTENGTLNWILADQGIKIDGFKGGKQGQMSQLKLIRDRKDLLEGVELSEVGTIDFKAGDSLKILTAGGGGFLPPPTSDHI